MNSTVRKTVLIFSVALTSMLLVTELVLAQQLPLLGYTQPRPPLPNPVLYFVGQEQFTANGKQWTRYMYAVDNYQAYPNEMFAAAPDLPPCGINTKSSRTWVDFYDQSGKRLNGFCTLSKAEDLKKIWFALEEGIVPPSWIYIELNDRKTNTKYKSNLAETML